MWWWSCLVVGPVLADEDPSLAPVQAWVVEAPGGRAERFDPSGLARWRGELVVVSDKAHFPDLYALSTAKARTAQTRTLERWRATGSGTDTEGLARCGDELYVVVEGTSQLVKIPTQGPVEVLDLDFSTIEAPIPPQWTWLNAGLEGVACSPDGRVWVAKEREPRAIIEIDPSSGRARKAWTQWGEADTAQTVDGTRFWPSWSDLQFLEGHLYALHRDGRRIVRFDPRTGQQNAAVQLQYDEAMLYHQAKPYGMAEGLLIEEGWIWLILDNNAKTTKAGPRAGEPAPMLFAFPRPAGF